MLTSGDVVELDLGVPTGSEAGLLRPAVVVTGQRVLERQPSIVQVVPLSTTLRNYESEVTVLAETGSGLRADSAAQCQHIRAVAAERVRRRLGNVGGIVLAQVRETIAVLLDV